MCGAINCGEILLLLISTTDQALGYTKSWIECLFSFQGVWLLQVSRLPKWDCWLLTSNFLCWLHWEIEGDVVRWLFFWILHVSSSMPARATSTTSVYLIRSTKEATNVSKPDAWFILQVEIIWVTTFSFNSSTGIHQVKNCVGLCFKTSMELKCSASISSAFVWWAFLMFSLYSRARVLLKEASDSCRRPCGHIPTTLTFSSVVMFDLIMFPEFYLGVFRGWRCEVFQEESHT